MKLYQLFLHIIKNQNPRESFYFIPGTNHADLLLGGDSGTRHTKIYNITDTKAINEHRSRDQL